MTKRLFSSLALLGDHARRGAGARGSPPADEPGTVSVPSGAGGAIIKPAAPRKRPPKGSRRCPGPATTRLRSSPKRPRPRAHRLGDAPARHQQRGQGPPGRGDRARRPRLRRVGGRRGEEARFRAGAPPRREAVRGPHPLSLLVHPEAQGRRRAGGQQSSGRDRDADLPRPRADIGGRRTRRRRHRRRQRRQRPLAQRRYRHDGRVQLRRSPPGPVDITISAPGFEPITVQETIVASESMEVKYRLSAKGGPLEVTIRGARPRARW